MKTEKKETINIVTELAEVIEQRKLLEKKEAALKDQVKAVNPKDGFIQAGNVLVVFNNKKRTTLDRKALEEKLGSEIEKFEIVTEYVQIDVKKVA